MTELVGLAEFKYEYVGHEIYEGRFINIICQCGWGIKALESDNWTINPNILMHRIEHLEAVLDKTSN